MRTLTIKSDGCGDYPTWCSRASDTINAVVLAANTAASSIVPAGANLVVFGATGVFYAKIGGTAAIPSVAITNGSGSDLNPGGYVVSPGDVISFIAPAATVITLSYYR